MYMLSLFIDGYVLITPILCCSSASGEEVCVTTVAPRYNEVPRYRKKMFVIADNEDPIIMNYLVNSKNIRYSGVI